MPTGNDIVNGALTVLAVLEQGGSPSSSDSTDALSELNIAWQSWSIDEGLIWQIVPVRFPLTAGVAQWTIGTSGKAQINAQPPARIYRVAVVTATGGAPSASSVCDGGAGYAANDTGIVLGSMGTQAIYTVNTVDASGAVLTFTLSNSPTGYQIGNGQLTQIGGSQPGVGSGFTVNLTALTTQGGQQRNDLRIVAAAEYYAHKDLSAQAQIPDEVYPDYNPDADGSARLFFYPVPAAASLTAEIQQGVNFLTWTLTGTYNLPPGFQDTLQYALAWRLLPRYGMAVAKETAEVVMELGQKAEARIRDMNGRNRQVPPAAVQPSSTIPQPAGGQ